MGFTVTHVAEAGYIAVRMWGRITRRTVQDLAAEIVRVARAHGCHRILNDARDATVAMPTMELVDIPSILSTAARGAGLRPYALRRAIVVSDDVDDFAFFETASRNRHQNVRVFRDADAALAWLLGR